MAAITGPAPGTAEAVEEAANPKQAGVTPNAREIVERI
ncbi:hypothetical protein HDA45_004474 [Amycolatopsis umgeniensis]|uniref:Uncharacterized protein n=1 Tax=Amycolatopsis umgeniensis TaxID=336628 RepID=A0A841B4Z9_9PSEU|nr:hypothetical protein [Amycolatopsis umgeniensis]